MAKQQQQPQPQQPQPQQQQQQQQQQQPLASNFSTRWKCVSSWMTSSIGCYQTILFRLPFRFSFLN